MGQFLVVGFNPTRIDPWSIMRRDRGKPTDRFNGPGISQRAAAARTQGPWRGLVLRKELWGEEDRKV